MWDEKIRPITEMQKEKQIHELHFFSFIVIAVGVRIDSFLSMIFFIKCQTYCTLCHLHLRSRFKKRTLFV